MIFRGQSARVAQGLVAVTVLASGCSNGDTSGAAPSPVAPTAGSASPTTGATGTRTGGSTVTTSADPWRAVPAAARQHTNAGAQAFAEFYLSQLNRSWRQADPSLLQSFGSASCKTCDNFVATASAMSQRRQRLDGDLSQVVASGWLPTSKPNLVVVDVSAVQLASRVVQESGRAVQTYSRQPIELQFRVAWTPPGRWSVASIKQVVAR